MEGCAAGKLLHASAIKTAAVRRAIQHGRESPRAPARRYGLDPKAAAEWKARTFIDDWPMGPTAAASTVLSTDKAIVAAFWRHMLLPLDAAPLPAAPKPVAAAQGDGDRPARRKLESDPLGLRASFVDAHDYARRLKTLKRLTPCEAICRAWAKAPSRFSLDPLHQMPGLNIESASAAQGAMMQPDGLADTWRF